jgi:hypothetical protein
VCLGCEKTLDFCLSIMYIYCMKRFQIYLPVRMWERLKKEAAALGISIAELIRRILDKYFEKKGV